MHQWGKAQIAWLLWIASTAVVASVLAAGLFMTENSHKTPLLSQVRAQFLPGPTTAGHYQIELACESCHRQSFTNRNVIQEACVGCHGAELKAANDKHPLAKFADPRNAELLANIDATLCVTCHVEHRPDITLAMGMTQPADFCFHCHQNIATDRPSHAGLAFDTCASAGCHNFHDNQALYEDFLLKHADEPKNTSVQRVTLARFREIAALLPTYPADLYPLAALDREQTDAPRKAAEYPDALVDDWLGSAHANAGVNCSACHGGSKTRAADWNDRPSHTVCKTCHELEQQSFQSGKHGMRLAQGMSPMTPAQARLPMKATAANTELNCTTCHGAHGFSVRTAAVSACLGCHDDEHSRSYSDSPHAALWEKELTGEGPRGSGVSCATCHMPRAEHRYAEYDLRHLFVQHNQNDTLRPNEKMIRPTCQACHGLGFSLDALADVELIRRNFKGSPATHVPGIEMAVARDADITRRREQTRTSD